MNYLKQKAALWILLLSLFTTFTSLWSQERPAPVPSQEEYPVEFPEELKSSEQGRSDSRFFEEFIQMLLYLGLLLVIMIVVLWVIKRMMGARIEQVNRGSGVKVIERRSLTHKTTIYIVDVLGKTLAIAESNNGVSLLCDLSTAKEKQANPSFDTFLDKE